MKCELRTSRGSFDVKVDNDGDAKSAAEELVHALDNSAPTAFPLASGGYVVLSLDEAYHAVVVVTPDKEQAEQTETMSRRLLEKGVEMQSGK